MMAAFGFGYSAVMTPTARFSPRRVVLCSLCIALALLLPAAAAFVPTRDDLVVVSNEHTHAPAQIVEYYASHRSVATDHIVRLKVQTAETIQRPDYQRLIETPIANVLSAGALQDKILYIVLTKGVPIRIAGTVGRDATMASV